MKTIRRSSVRNLPPSADSYVPAVVSSRAVTAGKKINVLAPCGVVIAVTLAEVEHDDEGWSGWADVSPEFEIPLQQAGVPKGPPTRMRVFSWQCAD